MNFHIRRGRSPWKTRYFLDTEFTSFENKQLISIGIVGEDGTEFYGECSDFDQRLCSDFVREVVLPQLGQFIGRSMPSIELGRELRHWLSQIPTKPKPILAYDFHGDYDLLRQLLEGDLPKGWKHENIALRLDKARLIKYVLENAGEHHALFDARANAYAYR